MVLLIGRQLRHYIFLQTRYNLSPTNQLVSHYFTRCSSFETQTRTISLLNMVLFSNNWFLLFNDHMRRMCSLFWSILWFRCPIVKLNFTVKNLLFIGMCELYRWCASCTTCVKNAALWATMENLHSEMFDWFIITLLNWTINFTSITISFNLLLSALACIMSSSSVIYRLA